MNLSRALYLVVMIFVFRTSDHASHDQLNATQAVNQNTIAFWPILKSIRLNQVQSEKNRFAVLQSEIKELSPYPVFQMKIGDVDNDGREDIILGVIKKTRYDHRARKRLFIFKIVGERIYPLWLGSRVSMPLYDFEVLTCDGKCIIGTIEQERNNTFAVATYQWHSFGLKFLTYLKRNLNLSDCYKQLQQYKKG